MPTRPSILALDDDKRFLSSLSFALEKKFNLCTATTVKEAFQVLEDKTIDAILLDYALGSDNGHSVLDSLRQKQLNQPVIVVSGAISLEMTVGFLKRRVFGFLEKPVSLPELEALLDEATRGRKKLKHSNLHIDSNTRKVVCGDEQVTLTPTEFEILMFFIKNKGRQVARNQITAHLWGETQVSRHTFDTHLLNLKKKLPAFADKLISVYGIGYCYED